MTQRLFSLADLSSGLSLELDKAQTHYLVHVMRKQPGERVLVFNGRDGEWWAEITQASKKVCQVNLLEMSRPQRASPDIMICFAPLKKDRLDFLVEKCTELGAAILQPVMTARTVVSRVNTERLTSLAIEASEQCERLDIPDVRDPLKLAQMIQEWPADRDLLILDEQGSGLPIGHDLLNQHKQEGLCHPAAVLVGPEGGFTPEELSLVSAHPSVRPISLGPRILRAETAAIAALTCWQAIQGDWDRPLKRP